MTKKLKRKTIYIITYERKIGKEILTLLNQVTEFKDMAHWKYDILESKGMKPKITRQSIRIWV